ncbi:hypothetical protein [Treponema pectinovorum]|nr:hypothetical protein [Treponema pectinovorum]
MGSFMTVENLTDVEFENLRKLGWILICVDSLVDETVVYSFEKEV